MLPFPEFGTMPTPGGATMPARGVAGSDGLFAIALRAMFEHSDVAGERAPDEPAADEEMADHLCSGKGAVEVAMPVRTVIVEAGEIAGEEPAADSVLPSAGLQAQPGQAAAGSGEAAERGQAELHGRKESEAGRGESTARSAPGAEVKDILPTGSEVVEAGAKQNRAWAPMHSDAERERTEGIDTGQAQSRRLEGLEGMEAEAAPGGPLEKEPRQPSEVREEGFGKGARVPNSPAAGQDPLRQEESGSRTRFKETGAHEEADGDTERSPDRDCRRPAGPDSGSGPAMVAVQSGGTNRDAKTASRPSNREESRSSPDGRRRLEGLVRPPDGLMEPRRPEAWGSGAENRLEVEPVAFALKSSIRGAVAEGQPEQERGQQLAVGKLAEVERLAGGALEGTKPEVGVMRDPGERVEGGWPTGETRREGADTRENRDPGIRGAREVAAPVRAVMEASAGPAQRVAEIAANASELVSASELGGRIEGPASLKQPSAAAPVSPAVRVEGMVDELQEARGAVREIRMTVEPERGKPIRLQFKEKAGQVEVTARSGDAATVAALRADLGRLRSLGYEAPRGAGGTEGPGAAARQEAEGGRSGEGGSRESTGEGNAGAGDGGREQRGRQAARWLEAFDRLRDGVWDWEKGEEQ